MKYKNVAFVKVNVTKTQRSTCDIYHEEPTLCAGEQEAKCEVTSPLQPSPVLFGTSFWVWNGQTSAQRSEGYLAWFSLMRTCGIETLSLCRVGVCDSVCRNGRVGSQRGRQEQRLISLYYTRDIIWGQFLAIL